ncbi:877_t:CDS:10 [Paraglomus occultum]|uniref:methylcrotonoyl-CoA carboxylase n=1 Tax=Paraglomus occultum TaxID=144539 RepID=A0A9N8ZI75_9GLOM|nr:877_t:CDS:10 [Paraglomus occultum]
MDTFSELAVLQTKVQRDSAYSKNYAEMLELVNELNERLRLAAEQGEQRHVDRHLQRGQLLARDRVELLLDEDSPFFELCPLAGWGRDRMTLGGSVVAGIGLVWYLSFSSPFAWIYVFPFTWNLYNHHHGLLYYNYISGVECMITANVPTMHGGSSNEVSVSKAARINAIAWENRLPLIQLIQTGGARLDQQSQVYHPGGAQFRHLAERSKAGLPTCSVVFGSSTAGGAYSPGMSDYVIMVKNQAQVFLGGPPLVQMATGEVTDAETAYALLCISIIKGVSDQLAQDEHDAIRKAREFVANLNWSKQGKLPSRHLSPIVEEPLYDIDELLGIVPANLRILFDANEVIARLVDGSRFTAFKPLYGPNLVTGWAYIHCIPVGILANNNVLFTQESNKATQFIQLCNMKNTPLLFLHNITGFMVGKKYEEEGIIKAGARFINAVSNSQVPAISIVMGASYGAGNYAMCGRAYNPRFLFSWPNSRCSVMGPEQLSGVMDFIMREAASRMNKAVDEKAAEARRNMIRAVVEEESDVYWTSSRLLDDGIIDPRMTRTIVGFCLSVIYNTDVRGGNLYGVSRM